MPAAAVALRPRREGRAARESRTLTPLPAATAPSAGHERARKRVVRLVFVLVLLAIVEGALRKWVAPQFGAYVFFLRDPVLLLIYVMATRHSLWPRSSPFFAVSIGMAIFGVLLLALQFGVGGHSEQRLILGLYGWRAYFLYAPLAFLVGAQFHRDDLVRLFKMLLWLAVPIALLVAAQFFSPHGAPINVGIAEEQELQFKGLAATGERTRPMGPFASGAGQQQFVATAFAILIAFFISPRRLPQPSFTTLIITGGAVLTCIAFSGSRGAALQCALALTAALMVGLIGRGGALKSRALLWPVALTVCALAAYPIVFPEGHAAFTERWTTADAAERRTFENSAVFGRAVYGLIDFVRYIEDTPIFGYGLGFGGNAAITLGAKIDGVQVVYAESDFARQMVDLGPLLGLGYILYRLLFAAWLTVLALRATRLSADPMPLLLWSYVAYIVVFSQLTGQGTINFFGWLFAGLLIAACSPPSVARRSLAPLPLLRRRHSLHQRVIT